jgi:hypothetical protein
MEKELILMVYRLFSENDGWFEGCWFLVLVADELTDNLKRTIQ